MNSKTITDLLASKINFILDMNALDSFFTTSFSSSTNKTRLVKNKAQELLSGQEKLNNMPFVIPSVPPAFYPKQSDLNNKAKER